MKLNYFISVAALLLSALVQQAHACRIVIMPADADPMPIPTAGPGIESGNDSVSPMIHLPNRALYQYNPATGNYTRVFSIYDPNASSEQLRPGDIWYTNGTSSADPAPQSADPVAPAASCNIDITTLPTVTVTGFAPPPGDWLGAWFERITIPSSGAGGGGGAIDRKIPRLGVKRADQTLTCQSDFDALRLAAITALRGGVPHIYASGDSYIVNYAPGNHMVWIVTSPLLSDLGLAPGGPCIQD